MGDLLGLAVLASLAHAFGECMANLGGAISGLTGGHSAHTTNREQQRIADGHRRQAFAEAERQRALMGR